jgi:hypothetical protein
MDKRQKEIGTIGAAVVGAALVSYGLYKALAPVKKPVEGKRDTSKPLPCIVSDIDGVIVKGDEQITNTPKVVQQLISGPQQVPFMMMTNNGGTTEQKYADKMNTVLGYADPSKYNPLKWGSQPQTKLEEKNVLLCHTIFKDMALLAKYHDKYILVDGAASPVDQIKVAN